MVQSQAGEKDPDTTEGLKAQDIVARRGRTLRLALAMRGGVSLAVWIGGALAEIDVLRRERFILEKEIEAPSSFGEAERKRAEIYRDLMALAGFARVEVDILAGASAGGLNGVVYAFAQSGGHRIDWLKPVWVKTGGLWQLFRRPGVFARPESLLDGDGYFYESVLKELRHRLISSEPDPRIVAPRLSLDLSATLLETHTDSTRNRPGDPPRNTAHFHFDRRSAPPESIFTDIPGLHAHDTDARTAALQTARLALAARSTSSFPGAFEPASIYTTQEDWTGSSMPSMLGVFSEVRSDEEFGNSDGGKPFRVIDGGVFDNIPVTRALQAIAAAPALGRVDRRLIYLDPSPPVEEPPRPTSRSAQGWLSVVVRSVLLKQRQELEVDELEAVRAHNEAQRLLEQKQRTLANWLRTREWPEPVEEPPKSYLTYRAASDARRLSDLVTRPNTALLRAWLQPRPFTPMTMEESLRIGLPISTFYRNYYSSAWPKLARDPQGLIDALTLLLAWLRALEDLPGAREPGNEAPAVPEDLQSLKTPVYRLLAVAVHLRNLSDTALLASCLGSLEQLPRGLEDSATRYRSIKSSQLLLDAIRPSDDPTAVSEDAFWSAMHITFGEHGAKPALVPISAANQARGDGQWWARFGVKARWWCSPRAPFHDALIDDLWALTDEIHKLVVSEPPADWKVKPTVESEAAWEESAFRWLYEQPFARAHIDRVHTLFATAGGVPGTTSVVRYYRITGDQESPLEGHFAQLERGALTGVVNRLVARPELADQSEPALFDATSKLAGNSLGNFAGFLKRKWREHDWIWGRADAAAGIVEVLLPYEPRAGDDLAKLWNSCVRTSVPGETPENWRIILGLGAREEIPTLGKSKPEFERGVLRRGVQAWLQYWTMAGELDEVRRPQLGPAEPEPEPPTLAKAIGVLDMPKPTLASLPKGYTFALACRLTALLPRVLAPSRWTWQSVLIRIALIAFRPLLALAPLLIDPVRILLVAALLGLVLLPADIDNAGGTPTAIRGPAEALNDVGAPAWVLSAAALLVAFVIVARLWSAWLRWNLAIRNASVRAGSPDVPGRTSSWPRIEDALKLGYAEARRWYLLPGIVTGVMVILVICAITVAGLVGAGDDWRWLADAYDGQGAIGAVGVVALLVLGLWATGRAQTRRVPVAGPKLPRISGGAAAVIAALLPQLAKIDGLQETADGVPGLGSVTDWLREHGWLVLCVVAAAGLVALLHHPWTTWWVTLLLMGLGSVASVGWVLATEWQTDNLAALAVGVVAVTISILTSRFVPPAPDVRGS